MPKDTEPKPMYTCKFKDGYYCKLLGVKPTGSIKGDMIGPRFCIQSDSQFKRGINCDKKSLVKVKEETLVT